MRTLLLTLGLGTTLAACSATQAVNDFTEDGSGGAAATIGSGGSGGAAPASVGSGGEGGIDITVSSSSSGGGPAAEAEVFAHTGKTLYRLDPITKAVTTVGDFKDCGQDSVIDIALDKDGLMFGTTFSGLYKLDKKTAQCTFLQSGNYPNSLSFVPKGTLDPNEEALVGYVDGTYVRIDPKTGTVSNVGKLGGGYVSSGDIVSVIGGGTYLTVKNNGCSDCIVEVDPKTGALIKNIGPLGYSKVFGLAFWGGAAYGFNDSGSLFQIDLDTAQTTALSMPGAPVGLKFYGAGSSTSVPLVVPK